MHVIPFHKKKYFCCSLSSSFSQPLLSNKNTNAFNAFFKKWLGKGRGKWTMKVFLLVEGNYRRVTLYFYELLSWMLPPWRKFIQRTDLDPPEATLYDNTLFIEVGPPTVLNLLRNDKKTNKSEPCLRNHVWHMSCCNWGLLCFCEVYLFYTSSKLSKFISKGIKVFRSYWFTTKTRQQ